MKKCYITNPEVVVEQGCDAALWSEECYGIHAKSETKKVGLNVIRPDIFGEYIGYVNKQILLDIYFALIKRLIQNGYEVELFTNGYKADMRFVRLLFKAYPTLNSNYKIRVVQPDTAEGLVDLISSYERYLAVRLHASIIGCALNIPNVNLVWNNKQLLFGKQIGAIENYITRENFDDTYIYAKLMSAERPQVDEKYKNSAYESLKLHIFKNINR